MPDETNGSGAAEAKPKRQRKPREPRPRQQHLPGMEPPNYPDIDEAAERYKQYRDSRMEEGREEAKWREILMTRMKYHGLKTYEYEDNVVALEGVEKIKVRKKKEEAAPDADE